MQVIRNRMREARGRMQEARSMSQDVFCISHPASCILLLISCLVLAACAPASAASSPLPTLAAPLLPTRTPLPTIPPRSTAAPPTPKPSPTLMPTVAPITADGWQPIRSGIFLREMMSDPISKTGRVEVVKIDPAQVDFHVHYQPESPLTVHEWYSTTQALVVINSSFFDSAHRAVGQLTTDGKSDGQSHERMEGAFYLTGVGAAVWPLRGWTKPAGPADHRIDRIISDAVAARRNCQSRHSQRCPHGAAHGGCRGSIGRLVVHRYAAPVRLRCTVWPCGSPTAISISTRR